MDREHGIDQTSPDDQAVPEAEMGTVPPAERAGEERGFMERLHDYALVHSTVDQLTRVYHSAHSSSRLVRLGASTVGYSCRLLGPQLRSLDSYAGRQLARLELLAEDPLGVVLNTGRSLFGASAAPESPSHDPSREKRRRLEATMESLHHAEAHINLLVARLRQAISQFHELHVDAEAHLSRMRHSITQEIVQILRCTVDLVNREGPLLPLPGQQEVRQFLISLPSRFGETLAATGASARLLFMANEAVVAIKSLAGIIAAHLYPPTTG